MEIVLNIGDEVAEFWKNISAKQKAQYEMMLTAKLKELQTETSELTEEQLTIIAEDAKGEVYEWWNDVEMMKELDQISADSTSGKIKGVSLEQSKAYLLSRLKNNDL